MLKLNKQWLLETTREERRSHLDLTQECMERGGNSTQHRGILVNHLNTDFPTGRILLCHACHNSKCSNPYHLYWGSDTDNNKDARENGLPSLYQKRINLHGEKKVKEQLRYAAKIGASLGGLANKGSKKTEIHKQKIAKANLGKRFVNDGKKNYYINGEEIKNYLNAGYIIGMKKRR